MWRVRGVGDDEWHFGQTTLIDDRLSRIIDDRLSRLAFQLTGDGVRAAVDDIRVIDGECPLDRSSYLASKYIK